MMGPTAVNLRSYMQSAAGRVEQALDHYTSPAYLSGAPSQIREAMRYSLLGGGKRLRPALVLAAASLFSADDTIAMPAACAMEMIHTYSLIHDDLPAMDDDDLRRGRPTNHKVFGEATAILAGDGLLTLAFQVLTECGSHPSVGWHQMARVIGEVAQAAGVEGMVGGQVLDLAAEGCTLPAKAMQEIHRLKTGAIFRASLRVGAILAGVDEPSITALTRYADAFGLAFQIQDDVLDVVGSTEILGKPVGSDERHAKSTYVQLYGLDQARRLARREVDAALGALEMFGERAELLRALVRYVVERER
jgi:geranylgeranyl diphosphate synthase type II